jgi:hypothetical protein
MLMLQSEPTSLVEWCNKQPLPSPKNKTCNGQGKRADFIFLLEHRILNILQSTVVSNLLYRASGETLPTGTLGWFAMD